LTRVVVENLTKTFGKTLAVSDLNLEVKDKEFVSLLGPSGCGKTTTLNCISGLEKPTKGDIYFDGQVVTEMEAKDRGVGLMFQSYAIFHHMTVFENLAFPMQIRHRPEAEIQSEVQAMADFLGVKELLSVKAARLSLPEMQKVALGRTLLVKPKVLLLDEPLSNLDAAVRAVVRAELKRLQKEVAQTTIFVTHDQLEAMTLSDRIAVMNLGKLHQYDAPETVYNHPTNRFVANFVGSPSMNFIDVSYEVNRQARLVNSNFAIDVTEWRNHLSKYASGSELTVGIRPERLVVSGTGTGIPATVTVTEPIGFESILTLQLGDLLIRAVVPLKTNFQAGDKVVLGFDKDHLHVFDRRSGETII
jgi:ABC-type sugar transport system ATPase subunit